MRGYQVAMAKLLYLAVFFLFFLFLMVVARVARVFFLDRLVPRHKWLLFETPVGIIARIGPLSAHTVSSGKPLPVYSITLNERAKKEYPSLKLW